MEITWNSELSDNYVCGCNYDKTTGACGRHGGGARCPNHQDFDAYVPYCETVRSMWLDDTQETMLLDTTDTYIEHLQCANHKWAEPTMEIYSCQGVRGTIDTPSRDPNTIYRYLNQVNQLSGDIVNSKTDYNVKRYLSGEVEQRKKHVWYNNLTLNVNTDSLRGQVIETSNQTSLKDLIGGLKGYIQWVNDYSNSETCKNNVRSVQTGDLVETNNYNQLERSLFAANSDCICYSDCTAFRVYKRHACTCNINCKCNY